MIEEWDEEFREALNRNANPKATPIERFEVTWQQLIETFETHHQMWVSKFDVFSQIGSRAGDPRSSGETGCLEQILSPQNESSALLQSRHSRNLHSN